MNKIIEIGRSVRDPDIKYSGDTTIVKYTLVFINNMVYNTHISPVWFAPLNKVLTE